MPSKLQAYTGLSDYTAARITGSYQTWTAFLATAGRLYKYPFPDQLMIYAQRPQATACAEYDFWNQKMRRYVRRGAKGIALIDSSFGRPFLRYVFDVADTGRMESGLDPNLWRYRAEHQEAVAAALEQRFGVPGEHDLAEQLAQIAAKLAEEYWGEHQEDIRCIVDGSFLEGYDAFNTGAAFKDAAAASITYMLMSRCGLEPEKHFLPEYFLSVLDFNTRSAATALGMAVSQSSEQVLRQIEVTVKKYERDKIAERSSGHGEQADVHAGGGLSVSQSGPSGAAGQGLGQVREDAPALSEGAPARPVGGHGDGRDAVQPPAGDRGRGQQPPGVDDAPAGESGGGHGAAEGAGPDGVGGAHEQLQGPGGGDYHVGADLQLSFLPPEIPTQREQMEAIREAESADAPSASAISQEDIDAALRRGPLKEGGKMRIFELYQQEITAKDAAKAIKAEYGSSGHSYTFSDGSNGFIDYSPSGGMKLHRYQTGTEAKVTWARVEKRIRQMVAEGSYLTPEEIERYRRNHPDQEAAQAESSIPLDTGLQTDYNKLKETHPNDIVLYQLGDLYEMYDMDARVASRELELTLTTRSIPDTGHVDMCSIPAHRLGECVHRLRERHDVTVSSIEPGGKRLTVSYPAVDREAINAVNAPETEASGESPPVHVPGAPVPIPAPAPVREATQDDIDAALQEWNGDIASKRAVAQYMEGHARDKGTAAWLRQEYGDNLPAFPVPSARTDLPWPKVQRHLARLIKEDRFFSPEELDNFVDIDAAAVREHLEQDRPSLFVEQVIADVEQIAANQEGTAQEHPTPAPTVQEIYSHYKPIIRDMVLADKAYLSACQNSDEENALLEGHEAVKRAALSITAPDFMQLYADMAEFRDRLHREILGETYPALSQLQQEQAVPLDLSERPITREEDTITIGDGDAAHEVDIAVSDEEWQTIQEVTGATDQPPHDPLAPAYAPGDTVYLDNTAFEITGIGLLDVELRDLALPIPLTRTESKENFERLLHQDSRNSRITSFLPANLKQVNDDFREVLTKHLLTDRDKGYISGWIRAGENNLGISHRLSQEFASRSETVTLETGDIADYFTSTISMAVEVQDKFGTKLSLSWETVAPVLRALWQQELDGFTHEPVQLEPVELEGQLNYQVGDKVAFSGGDHDISGTIESIGELDVLIHTGPYAWSHEMVSRDFFEDAVRHDGRNAALFTPDAPEQEAPAPGAGTATIYPGDKNDLPYDEVIQTLHVDEPARDQPVQAPAAKNFRITDDRLGEGGPKAKFRRNMEAINTLQAIELEGRAATSAEQEILSRYVGWGGLPDAFDPDKPDWTNEFLELQAALAPEEYESARRSTLNAHYTSPTVIRAIYEAVGNMGFHEGNILEPACGVGNFFGLLPESMAASKLYGVELDSITGRIAQQLYPRANIAVRGYEKTNFPRDFFDLAIGNVPFGQYSVRDREYNKLGFHIHNYFFAKTLDRVRPGGVVAFLTSRYTLDARDTKVRKYLAEQADLLGAIRLPNNAFKANAGTEVVSDIIFLQKRDTPAVETPSWVYLSENEDGFAINRYFAEHPEMVLGEPASESTQYGRQDYTVAPIPGADLAQQLHEAVSHIHGAYREAAPPELDENIGETELSSIPADPSVKNYSYAVVDGEVYYRENSVMVRPRLTTAAKERVISLIELRDCVRELIDLQMEEYTPDSVIREKQKELDRLYDAFAAQYGLINDRTNRMAFDRDSAYYLLCSLEVLDDDGRLKRKADMFAKRTIKQNTRVTSVDTAVDALAVSIGERARVDMPFMAQLTGKPEAELERELTGVIFRDIRCDENPDHIPRAYLDMDRFTLVPADEYLSGNVRQKLRMARAFCTALPPEQRERAKANVDALAAAQPKDLDASEIEVRLGTDWIDKRYIQQFMYETLKTPNYLRGKITVNYSRPTTEWFITCKNSIGDDDVAACTTYGTSRANAYRILEDSLNLRDVRIYDTIRDEDGKEKRVLNARETTLAAQKQQALRDAFKDWIWADPQRRQALVKQYNEEMNCIRPREYDGSRIQFIGINPEIKLKTHQINAVARVLYGGNTLLAHEVGAGKTFEMIAAAMESKRLGLCHKSIFVVPNHLTGQTASEFLRLYPSANILVTTERDFETRKRKKFCARIATGDYDAVIIGHSQFEKIPISPERQKKLLQEQIWEITEGISEMENSGGERFTVKQLERTKRQLEARLEKLQADHRKDDVVTFEQLGVDMMFVDESDNYKNLFLYTKMRNVAGLATTDAQKSSDMFAKCRYLDEITKSRGIVFATGTPISNSMTEMYVRP